MLALFAGNMRIIKCLLPISNQNSRDNNGNTPFIIAAANGNTTVMEMML
jgi:ankyrin repeat protein